jgi:hypothetical protein
VISFSNLHRGAYRSAARAKIMECLKMTFSIVIPNCNYGRFVGKAIESASAVEWPDLEVVVADGGSTSIITVMKQIVHYRSRGPNERNLIENDANFGRQVARVEARWKFSFKVVEDSGLFLSKTDLFRGLRLRQFRVASLRVDPDLHPLVNDSRLRAMRDTVQAAWSIGSLYQRVITGVWPLLTLVALKPLAMRLIALRFARRSVLPMCDVTAGI